MEQVPDVDVLDKAISLLQWTAQELASASGSDAKPGAFSLPSSFGSFHSDSLDAALRELESMQRSTSTERLHRLLADGEAETGHEGSPTARTLSASSQESALSLLSILSTSSSMAEAISIFLDTEFPGAREVIDPDGFLGQADIGRLPSLHPRASELEFLRDLRALELQPGPAPDQHGDQPQLPFSTERAEKAQPAQQTSAEGSRLTAEVLRKLSAEHIRQVSPDAAHGSQHSSPSRKGPAHLRSHLTEAPESPGTPPKKRKAHRSSGLMPQPAESAGTHADIMDIDTDVHVDDSDEYRHMDLDQSMPDQRVSSVDNPASQQDSLRPPPWKAKRRRTWRSEDSDPSWQPADEPQVTSTVEVARKEPKRSMAVTPPVTRRKVPDYTKIVAGAAHVPKSKYKGVSCHKATLRWESSLWLDSKQVYLGGFATEDDAARAYDLAAIGCKGPSVETNFPVADYAEALRTDLAGLSQEEVIAFVRRRSNAFSRGKSRYRGVSGREGRWEVRIGTFAGLKNVSFGVHDEEDRAGRMYDRAIIVERGRGAKTNFPLHDYEQEIADFETFMETRFGDLPAAAREEERARVYLPLDEYVALYLTPTNGLKTKKPRPRKVNGIRAVNLQAALLRPA